MTTPFRRDRGLIVVSARIEGPTGATCIDMALDTGATHTIINSSFLISVGYDPADFPARHRLTTASGFAFVPRIMAGSVSALGIQRQAFPVIAHTLPRESVAKGLLGLDFLRDHRLVLDFRQGVIDVD